MSVSIFDIAALHVGPVTPGRWTAIIPAAGRGSRLGSDRPKILYPILGRPILDWLLDAVTPVCGRVVVVLSVDGAPLVEPALRQRLGAAGQVVIQEQPIGMADAVRVAESVTQTEFALVVWGDQVTLRAETIEVCASLHERRAGAALTLATVMKRDPYIDVERDEEGRIVRVRQAREGEIERDVGENDCGLFLFTAKDLFATLHAASGAGRGNRTGETNLLQLLPAFERGPGSVATVRLDDADETLGVNTAAEAAAAARILMARRSTKDQRNDNTAARRKVSIVIPAYNEEAFIGALLRKLLGVDTGAVGFDKEIIVVNDGSKDRTAEITAAVPGVRLINQENRGKGAAVQRGVREATGDFVLVQDADLEYEPDDIPAMLKALGNEDKTAVYGSRILGVQAKQQGLTLFPGLAPGQQLGPWVVNRALSVLAFILYGRWITDLLTGYKIYPTAFLRGVQVKTAGFETDHELTAKLIRAGYQINEVPAEYRPRSVAEGKKIGPLDGLIAVWTLLRFRVAS